jgi:DNA-binding MarR family transcriptional regulator
MQFYKSSMSKEFGNERRLAKRLGFRKKYSLPVLIILNSQSDLTFAQLYDLSAKAEGTKLSIGSLNRALKELLEMEYIKKRAKLVNRRACITYVLTKKAKKGYGEYL